jgi:hypothetical protein
MIARRERRRTDTDTLSLRVTYTLTDIRNCLSAISHDYNALGLHVVIRNDLTKMVGVYLFGYLCAEAQQRFATWAIDKAVAHGLLDKVDDKTLKFSV